jgi:para-nitrobenzyl esterase
MYPVSSFCASVLRRRAGLDAPVVSLCVLSALLAVVASNAADSGLKVSVTGGQIRGVRLAMPGGGVVFRGIPFAQPPIGALRWREPMPVKPWTGVRDAGVWGSPCAQNPAGYNNQDAAKSSEDCLYLNVWAPEWPSKSRLPVMLWFHGGSNTGGAGSEAVLAAATLYRRGVVYVTTNYRLGAFGFFAHSELRHESAHEASGNYGLLDQIAALKWVHENIAQFGGDPGNVTVFGQSAGAMDLGLLMTSPLTKGLFHRAIAESGAAIVRGSTPLRQAEEAGAKFAESLGAPAGADAIQYLRSLSTAEILKAMVNQAGGAGANIDGWVLPRSAAEVFSEGQEHPVPLVIGNNARENAPRQADADSVRKAIQDRYGSLAPKALQLYSLDGSQPGTADPLYGGAADQWAADTSFRCPAVVEAEWRSRAGHPTYEYQFDHAIPGRPSTSHSGELPYVHGSLIPTGVLGANYGELDRKISEIIQQYWTNFARTGNPNGGKLPFWPQFDAAKRSFLEFTDDGPVVKSGLRRAYCEVFEENLNEQMKH